MKLVVGLGNPGRAYERTRHNAGFEVVDELARRAGADFRRSWRWPVVTAEVALGPGRVVLVKPQAYMNRSWPPVAALAGKRGVKPDEILVVVDDVDLPPGVLRLRRQGSAGGHNGLKSMVAGLGSEAFARLRVGVGRPTGSSEMVDHVLTRYTPAERETMEAALVRAADAVQCVMEKGLDRAMNEFNG